MCERSLETFDKISRQSNQELLAEEKNFLPRANNQVLGGREGDFYPEKGEKDLMGREGGILLSSADGRKSLFFAIFTHQQFKGAQLRNLQLI